jgi:hypothetical protein
MSDSYGKDREWTKLLPNRSLDIYEEYLNLFFETMFERQEIWYKRFIKNEPRPWTENQILNDYKFTNVYRELDRNSQYLIKNIIMVESNPIELLWKMMFYRYFNCPETFEFLKTKKPDWGNGIPSRSQYDASEFLEFITEFRDAGNNPFTQAYLINSMACPGQKRDWCYTQKVIPSLLSNVLRLFTILKSAKTPEEIIQYLKRLPAIADFIAHEFYQDFTYVDKYSPFGLSLMKFDQNDFTNVGPGCNLGIRLVMPNRETPDQKLQAIYDLRDISHDMLAQYGEFKYIEWNKKKLRYNVTPGKGQLSLHQIEMQLCEFQKYWKMMIGEGKQRSKFIEKTKSIEICR